MAHESTIKKIKLAEIVTASVLNLMAEEDLEPIDALFVLSIALAQSAICLDKDRGAYGVCNKEDILKAIRMSVANIIETTKANDLDTEIPSIRCPTNTVVVTMKNGKVVQPN